MPLRNFVKSEGFYTNLYTLFVSSDNGKSWVRMVGGRNLGVMTMFAYTLLQKRDITHFVIASGDYNEP